jgi:hypothetical protein
VGRTRAAALARVCVLADEAIAGADRHNANQCKTFRPPCQHGLPLDPRKTPVRPRSSADLDLPFAAVRLARGGNRRISWEEGDTALFRRRSVRVPAYDIRAGRGHLLRRADCQSAIRLFGRNGIPPYVGCGCKAALGRFEIRAAPPSSVCGVPDEQGVSRRDR